MNSRFLRDTFGWGAGLWLLGYMLGIMLFPFVPNAALGWIISPIGAAATIVVLNKRVHGQSMAYYLEVALVWTALAVILDQLFLVQAFGAADYYKLDVYVYYALIFILPLAVGAWKLNKLKRPTQKPGGKND